MEIERAGDDGRLTVVVRPRPAPLLVDARVEGDQVLSARTLRRITRLRHGEPLWASRREQAGREAALALVERGYLEALVEVATERAPGGAIAVFRVRSGPRVRVGSVSISGAGTVPGVSLDDLVRPRRGGIYRRDQATKAAEAMRLRLARADHWQATVTVRETYCPRSRPHEHRLRGRARPPHGRRVSGNENPEGPSRRAAGPAPRGGDETRRPRGRGGSHRISPPTPRASRGGGACSHRAAFTSPRGENLSCSPSSPVRGRRWRRWRSRVRTPPSCRISAPGRDIRSKTRSSGSTCRR